MHQKVTTGGCYAQTTDGVSIYLYDIYIDVRILVPVGPVCVFCGCGIKSE